MCGIVSIIQKNWNMAINFSAERMFKQMLFADALRGTDGTGIFWHDNKKNQVFFNKLPTPSWEAIPKLQELNDMAGVATWVVGHNRKATMGVHTYENTHPFNEGNIVLVHNGTLTNQWALEKEVGKCAVDSQAITKLLDKYKPKQALEMLEGAYALVWYNTKESKMYYARNEERPLWLVESEQYYFLVSEKGLATWIAERNDIKIIKVTEVPVGKIYSLMVNKADKLHTNVVNFTPKAKKVVYQYQAPTVYTQPYRHNTPNKAGPEKWFKIGDVVLFKMTSSYTTNGMTKIRGYTVDKPVYFVETEPASSMKPIPKYGEIVEALITGIKYEFNSWTIQCTSELVIDTFYMTEDDVILTDRICAQLDSKECIACDAKATNDMEEAYVYYNSNTQEYDFLCPTCNKLNISGDMKNYGTI